MPEIIIARPKHVAITAWENAQRLLDNRGNAQFRNPMTTLRLRNEGEQTRVVTRPNDVNRNEQGGWFYSTAETVLYDPRISTEEEHMVGQEGQVLFPISLRDWRVENGQPREWGSNWRLGQNAQYDRVGGAQTRRLVGRDIFNEAADGALSLITVSLDVGDPLKDGVDNFGRTALERTADLVLSRNLLDRTEELFKLGRAHNGVKKLSLASEYLGFQTEWGKITLHSHHAASPGDQITIAVERRDDYDYEFDAEDNGYKVVPVDRYVVKRNLGTIQLIQGKQIHNGLVIEQYIDPPKPEFASLASSERSNDLLERLMALGVDQMILT